MKLNAYAKIFFLNIFLILSSGFFAHANIAEKYTTGDRIIFGSIGEPSNLIPALASDSASHEISSHLFVSPLRYNKLLEVEPFAAKSYEVLNDGKLLKFELREDIKWADGVELTADDVEFTYKMMIDPKTPTAYAANFLAIKEFKKTGKFSFEVYYEKPYSSSIQTWMSSIMPKHLLEGQDLQTTKFSRNPVGAGPFKLKAWNVGANVILEASDTYFEGRPYIDEIIYKLIPDSSTMFLELKAGNLDSMSLSPQQYLRQTNGKFWEDNYRKYKYLSFAYTYLGYNLKHPFFKDEKVRQALTYAIDRQSIIDGVLLGQGEVTNGSFKPGSWAYNKNIVPYPYSPGKARELLKEAGFELNEDGLLERDGKVFSFSIITNQGNTQRIQCAVIIQSQLRELGIEVKVRTIEWAAFVNEFINKKRFEAVILGWTIPQDPNPFDVWHSSKAKGNGLNFISYSNKEVDELLEKAQNTTGLEARKKAFDRFQEIVHKEQPYTFLYVPYALPTVQARFHGIKPEPAGIMYNFDKWYVPKDMQKYSVKP